ncbi:hypothetical protein Goari_018153 [Gossypium aridum]|uniref:Aminotransferase-like plant mobile domain-containing protein n=1 Tax=Gossypium aridum TaxID=34290 RepID=A0A7J8WNW0_GOSAI|nr:hypothetical protein [Gossypium aridum]
MLGGTKLDPPLINALVKIWRMDTHTFHPPNVARADSSATCEQLLGNVSNKFRGSWIEMGWLEDNFKTIEASASNIEKEQFVTPHTRPHYQGRVTVCQICCQSNYN